MAINVSKLTIPLEVLLPEGHDLLLLHVHDYYQYIGNKKTDVRLGSSYDVIENGGDFQRFSIKVEDSESAVLEDEIKASPEKVRVAFSNALCRMYVDASGRIQVSVKADSIEVL